MKRFALALSAIVVGVVVSSCAVGVRQPASDITKTSATLNGKVLSTTGGPGSWYIEYGPTEARTERIPTRDIDFAVIESEPVSEPVDGLEPGTTYHFAVCAEDGENPGDPFCSPDQTFITRPDHTGDSVVGSGSFGVFLASSVDVASGPSGENPTGQASVTLAGGEVIESSSIDCLAVSGDSATYAGTLRPSSFGYTHFQTSVIDNGPSGPVPDRAAASGFTTPQDCSAVFDPAAFTPMTDGDIVVTDAQPVATTRR